MGKQLSGAGQVKVELIGSRSARCIIRTARRSSNERENESLNRMDKVGTLNVEVAHMGAEVRAAANAADHYGRILVVRARDHLPQTVEVLEL